MFKRKRILCAISLLFVFENTFAKREITETGIPETGDNVRRSKFGTGETQPRTQKREKKNKLTARSLVYSLFSFA